MTAALMAATARAVALNCLLDSSLAGTAVLLSFLFAMLYMATPALTRMMPRRFTGEMGFPKKTAAEKMVMTRLSTLATVCERAERSASTRKEKE